MLDTTKKVQVIPEVGMGATIKLWSDCHACTVIEVSNNGKRIKVQHDKATIDPDFKINMVRGGFVGHVTNNRDQKYTYEANPEGSIEEFSLRKDGKWYAVGQPMKHGSVKLNLGERYEFYDYNY